MKIEPLKVYTEDELNELYNKPHIEKLFNSFIEYLYKIGFSFIEETKDIYGGVHKYSFFYNKSTHHIQISRDLNFIFYFVDNYKNIEIPKKLENLSYHHGERMIHFNNLEEVEIYFNSLFKFNIRNLKLNRILK